MSAYGITTAAVIKRLSQEEVLQLTDDAHTDAIDDAVVSDAIAAAEEELHLFAGVYYETPLRTADNGIPDIVTKLLDLIAWRLKQRRPDMIRNDQDEGKLWATTRDSLEQWFDDISTADTKKRKPIPGAVPRVVPDPPRAGGAKVVADLGIFTRARMGGFR